MKKRILVIDDEASITQWISTVLLNTERYDVDTSNDPLEARERATTIKYDLLISDIKMPKLNGDQLYVTLDVDPETGLKTVRRPKLLLISGAVDDNGMMKRREAIGAASFLLKPFQPEELLNRVDSLLCDDPN